MFSSLVFRYHWVWWWVSGPTGAGAGGGIDRTGGWVWVWVTEAGAEAGGEPEQGQAKVSAAMGTGVEPTIARRHWLRYRIRPLGVLRLSLRLLQGLSLHRSLGLGTCFMLSGLPLTTVPADLSSYLPS